MKHVFDYVNRKYGPCVERVYGVFYGHVLNPNMPTLFKKAVFNTSSTPTTIWVDSSSQNSPWKEFHFGARGLT